MVETKTRSKEEQAASLQFELKNLQAERDAIPTYRAGERQRVQSEIDKVQSNLDAVNSGAKSEAKTEVSPKVELSAADMVRLVVEYNDLKKTQSELNSAHSDRKRIDDELTKISAELQRNNVDTDNRLMMALIDANQKMAKELGELRGKQEEAIVEEVESSAEQADPAETTFRKKSQEISTLLTSLDVALNLFATDKVKGAEEINKVVAQLEAAAAETVTAIGQVKNEETKQKYQERWEKRNIASKIEDAKKLIAVPEAATDDADLPEGDAGAAAEDSADEVEGTADDTSEEPKAEVEPKLGIRARIFGRITGMFTGAINWWNKNAGERDEGGETVVASSESAAETASTTDEKDKEESARVYEVQTKSLNNIESELKAILQRKKDGKSEANDAKKFASAMDALYITDLEIINDEETSLVEDDQVKLNEQINQISDVLEDEMGINWDVVVTNMENEVEEKATIADEAEDRIAWFTKLFAGEESVSADTEVVEEKTPASAPGLDEANDAL